jgi:2'-hydroxyisoflavone reductase
MRILVLGGSEFIGKAIVTALLHDHDITVLNRGNRKLDGTTQLTADRNDRRAVSAALDGADFDAIVDVSAVDPAWVTSVLDVVKPDPRTRYVYISSAAVYDVRPAHSSPNENAPANGAEEWGDYGRAKAACERLLGGSAFKATIFRPPYVYGPHNNMPREGALWAAMLAGDEIRVPATRATRAQFCHVDVLAQSVRAACDGSLDAGVFNIGEQRSYEFAEYVSVLAAVAGVEARIVPVTDPSIPARSYFPFRDSDLLIDVSKIGGQHPSLEDGLASTYTWFTSVA